MKNIPENLLHFICNLNLKFLRRSNLHLYNTLWQHIHSVLKRMFIIFEVGRTPLTVSFKNTKDYLSSVVCVIILAADNYKIAFQKLPRVKQ